MQVVNPNDSQHTVALVPRRYPSGAITVTMNGATVTNSYAVQDGKMALTFTRTFTDREKVKMEITQGAEVLYRGMVFATTQTPQDYRKTTGKYSFPNG